MLYDNKGSWLQNKRLHNNGVSRGEDDDNKNRSDENVALE